MADPKDIPDEMLTPEERRKRAKVLTQEIAHKYDPSRLSKIVVGQAGRGERLEEGLRSEMEGRLGGDFSNVRIFRGPFAEAVTRQHKAAAVTVGATGMILVREGPRADTSTTAGRSLLAHELTHVAQAQRGLHFDTGGENPDAPHEVEARASESAAAAPAGHGGGGGGPNPQEVMNMVVEKVIQICELEQWLACQRGNGGH